MISKMDLIKIIISLLRTRVKKILKKKLINRLLIKIKIKKFLISKMMNFIFKLKFFLAKKIIISY